MRRRASKNPTCWTTQWVAGHNIIFAPFHVFFFKSKRETDKHWDCWMPDGNFSIPAWHLRLLLTIHLRIKSFNLAIQPLDLQRSYNILYKAPIMPIRAQNTLCSIDKQRMVLGFGSSGARIKSSLISTCDQLGGKITANSRSQLKSAAEHSPYRKFGKKWPVLYDRGPCIATGVTNCSSLNFLTWVNSKTFRLQTIYYVHMRLSGFTA